MADLGSQLPVNSNPTPSSDSVGLCRRVVHRHTLKYIHAHLHIKIKQILLKHKEKLINSDWLKIVNKDKYITNILCQKHCTKTHFLIYLGTEFSDHLNCD